MSRCLIYRLVFPSWILTLMLLLYCNVFSPALSCSPLLFALSSTLSLSVIPLVLCLTLLSLPARLCVPHYLSLRHCLFQTLISHFPCSFSALSFFPPLSCSLPLLPSTPSHSFRNHHFLCSLSFLSISPPRFPQACPSSLRDIAVSRLIIELPL